MKPEINSYITRNYYELLNICKKMTKNSDWAGDLLQDVLVQLYDKKEIKLDKLDDNNIKYYIVKCIKINWFSETSPFYRKVKRESSLYSDLKDISDVPVEDNNMNEHFIMDTIEQEFGDLNWFHKDILTRYMTLGSLKKVSKDTTIPLTSVSRYVNEAKTQIKLNTFRKIK